MATENSGENEKEGKKEENFESRLSRLEAIVKMLEKGEMPLEQSLTKFEEGIGLMKKLREELDSARAKVEILTVKENGTYSVDDFK